MKLSDIYGWDGRIQKSFWSKVEKTDGCWNWLGSHSNGYGMVRNKNFPTKLLRANRVAYVLTHFEVPDDLYVCHSCDNPLCVNPKHLWLGTNGDNTRDAKVKGRFKGINSGERNGMTNLTTADVKKIRERVACGAVQCKIAEEYSVSHQCISRIIAGKRWNNESN